MHRFVVGTPGEREATRRKREEAEAEAKRKADEDAKALAEKKADEEKLEDAYRAQRDVLITEATNNASSARILYQALLSAQQTTAADAEFFEVQFEGQTLLIPRYAMQIIIDTIGRIKQKHKDRSSSTKLQAAESHPWT